MGYRHMADHARDRMHRDTASQAERVGLWQWVVFILKHIEDVWRRREAVEACWTGILQIVTRKRRNSLLMILVSQFSGWPGPRVGPGTGWRTCWWPRGRGRLTRCW